MIDAGGIRNYGGFGLVWSGGVDFFGMREISEGLGLYRAHLKEQAERRGKRRVRPKITRNKHRIRPKRLT